MSYELTELLQRCNVEDAELIIANIDSYINFTDDKGLKEWLEHWRTEGGKMPLPLARKLETEIRYLGSSDVAYLARKLRGKVPAGVPVDEMLRDICKVLKIKQRRVSTLEGRLEEFAKGVVDKAFFDNSPEEQLEMLKNFDFSEETRQIITDHLKMGKKLALPMLRKMIGPKATMSFIEAVIYSVIAMFVGKEAAKQLLKTIMTKCPWLAALGPVAIAALTGWTVLDLCGPAMRKTIPILLHLSLVSLQNGPEDQSFWKPVEE